jgi:hypothetical protein
MDAEGLFEATSGLLGDVLIEGPRRRACRDDALDGGAFEGAEARGVREGGVEIERVEACTELKDAAGLMSPDARGTCAEEAEEARGAFAHALEGDGELIEVDRALAAWRRMEAARIELLAGALRGELVARDAGEIRGVDEELPLRDADGQDVGDVVVRDGVAVALPVDEAVDAADAVDDAGCIVRMPR